MSFVKELWDECDFFFNPPETYDQDVVRKRWKTETPGQIKELRNILAGINDFSAAGVEEDVKKWILAKGYNTGAVMNAFRLLLVGASRGPHIFDIIEWLGREETLKRIDKGVAVIGIQLR